MRKKAIYYEDERNGRPVEEFIKINRGDSYEKKNNSSQDSEPAY
ncbi:MAG: hypothetical protein Q7J72_10010 [Candidatus Omnitrophota bacterium]|nr:hypothetical protein [Candidatus Omnitrophota bacterium]